MLGITVSKKSLGFQVVVMYVYLSSHDDGVDLEVPCLGEQHVEVQ